ncbi:hypothetical protein DFS33DRAFT_1371505 [Desarmillaria ectypa]|nr:hypothetical protein DFS33DRAFT_1371505 [Desarmillaria ectypa]
MVDLKMATVTSLSGRVGLVTGGGTEIGFTIFKAFAANGATVYTTARRLKVLEDAAASITVVPLWMDVTDEESVKTGAKHIEGIDGKLDVLVNNAGFAASFSDPDFVAKRSVVTDPLELETVWNWMDIFSLNAIPPFFVVRAFQSLLIKGAHSRSQGTSSVINISSVAAEVNNDSYNLCMAYGVTKAALEKLTLRNIPIWVNALEPGLFVSQLLSPDFIEAIKTKPPPGLVALVPARRHRNDAEMTMTALYLAVSDYTNGVILRVDGGVSLVNP